MDPVQSDFPTGAFGFAGAPAIRAVAGATIPA
jgi:hypothetical protein